MTVKAKSKSQAQPATVRRKPKAQTPRKMPKFEKAPEWIKELFADLINRIPEAEPRKMFGYPCAFVNGNMLCGVFADRLMLRLAAADRARFLKLPQARPFEPMPGRAMKEYVEVPPQMLKKRSRTAEVVEERAGLRQDPAAEGQMSLT